MAIHKSADDEQPLGGGVVIDALRVLTCAHVVSKHSPTTPMWVAFPKAGVARSVRRQVVRVTEGPASTDVAVLELAQPVPPQVRPAPLLSPHASDLVDEPWWAFGFPHGEPLGSDAHGVVGAALSYGWMRLDTESRHVVKPGFSGSGVWSPRYEAIVGLIAQAQAGGDHRGDAVAVTLHQAVQDLPQEKLAGVAAWSVKAAGEAALAAWGWSLETDVEAVRHWRPRARGVAVDSEGGFRFKGRRAALTAIVGWLDRPDPDRSVMVVTGSPGVGKSAVLGRVVTTADAHLRAALPDSDDNVKATAGSVACAVHVKGKTALDVAVEIARAAAIRLPSQPDEVASALYRRLAVPEPVRFNIVLDALDEATDTQQARLIISEIVLPIARTCAEVGAKVVVGSRRRDDGGDLLTMFEPDIQLVDLDAEQFFEAGDLFEYTLATLQLTGAERVGSPYTDTAVAGPVAARIAGLAQRNFLVAGLVARRHGLYDVSPADPEALVSLDVSEALDAYLRRLPSVASASASLVLTALAFAEAPGLTIALWRTLLCGLGADVNVGQLTAFADSSAANFLIESSTEGTARRYRLFHQALNDTLLTRRAQHHRQVDDEARITAALTADGNVNGWAQADPYLLRSLPWHAHRAGVLDKLLLDDHYLLRADLLRLLPLATSADLADTARNRVRLLRLTPTSPIADPPHRAALFSVTAALEGLGVGFAGHHPAPYRAAWAAVVHRTEWSVLEGHTGPVWALCPVVVQGRTLLASAGDDRTVRLWDPETGQQQHLLQGNTGSVRALCPVVVQGRTLLASAGDDTTMRLWDPETGQQQHLLQGNTGSVWALCPVVVQGRTLLASAGDDATVRLWDPETGQQQRLLQGHTGSVRALCPVVVQGRTLLASAGNDRTVRLWDPETGQQRRLLQGNTGPVRAVCPVVVQGRTLLASAGTDATVRLWDPETGQQQRLLQGHPGSVRAVCPVVVQGRTLLASAGDDTTMRLWDPETGQQQHLLQGNTNWVWALCPVVVQGRTLLASAGDDRTVRLWDPETGQQQRLLQGNTGSVRALCPVVVQGRTLLASAGDDATMRLWDPETGQQRRLLQGNTGSVWALCPVVVQGRTLLASAGSDRTVRLWDPATGQQRRRKTLLSWIRPASIPMTHRGGSVWALCPVVVQRRTLLASAGDDRTVRLWDPETGQQQRLLQGHTGPVRAVCPVVVQGRTLLASAGYDTTVRLWDPETGQQQRLLQGHTGAVRALCPVVVQGRILLASAGDDTTVRLWDPETGQQQRLPQGHTGPVRALCPVVVQGRTLLASAGSDATVRLWDPETGSHTTIPVHHQAYGLACVGNELTVALSAGLLSIRLQV